MQPAYDDGTIIIEWYEPQEKKKSIHHRYEAEPIKVQLHPKNPELIVRAYFSGKMPGWLKKYSQAKGISFECDELKWGTPAQPGWWLANTKVFEKDETPFTAPNLRGALKQFIQKIPMVCPEWIAMLKQNEDTIIQNLKYYPDGFQRYGLFYRSEEINGDGGCLLVDGSLFIDQRAGELDDDYRMALISHGGMERLVSELTVLLPDPSFLNGMEDELSNEDGKSSDGGNVVEELDDEPVSAESEEEPLSFTDDVEELEFDSADGVESFVFDEEESFSFEDEVSFSFEEEESFSFEETEEPPFEFSEAIPQLPIQQVSQDVDVSEADQTVEAGGNEVDVPSNEGTATENQDHLPAIGSTTIEAVDLILPVKPNLSFNVVTVTDRKSGNFEGQLSLW